MVVAWVTRFETQIVTRSGLGSLSRTIANAATADSSCPAVSTCAMTSASGLIGVVIVLNGAAASSPEIRASALRVTASSETGASTTTSPRHCRFGLGRRRAHQGEHEREHRGRPQHEQGRQNTDFAERCQPLPRECGCLKSNSRRPRLRRATTSRRLLRRGATLCSPGRVRCERPAPPTSHTVAALLHALHPSNDTTIPTSMFRSPFTVIVCSVNSPRDRRRRPDSPQAALSRRPRAPV